MTMPQHEDDREHATPPLAGMVAPHDPEASSRLSWWCALTMLWGSLVVCTGVTVSVMRVVLAPVAEASPWTLRLCALGLGIGVVALLVGLLIALVRTLL